MEEQPPEAQVIQEQHAQTQTFGQPPVVYETKSSLPVVVGVLYAIYQVLPILGGLALLFGGAILGGIGAEYGDDEATGLGALAALFGLLILIIGAVGIWAGVLIAQRKKLGVHIAWGTIGLGAAFSIVLTTLEGMTPDIFTLGCNGICALFVGLPLMVSSASQHME
ncbi:MAG: hypothetical protein CMA79_02005 [Euryarchaeota archaeon]|nr:hypothetical protein [Euryarchaeota archaeon]